MNFQDLREHLKNLQLTDNDRYEILLDITQRQAKRIEHLNDILDQDHRQEAIESMYEENKRYREALEEILDSSTNDIAEFLAHKALEGDQ